MTYSAFKKRVKANCHGFCENPNCTADMETVHHFFKQSVYPEYATDPDNGMGACGPCHAEIERRLRVGESVQDLYPKDRYAIMAEKLADWVAGQIGGD
jgi:hypothetical protein